MNECPPLERGNCEVYLGLVRIQSVQRVIYNNYRKLCKTVKKISLAASFKIWLAKRSNDWAPGQIIKAY